MPELKPWYLNEAPPILEADRLLTEFLGKQCHLSNQGMLMAPQKTQRISVV